MSGLRAWFRPAGRVPFGSRPDGRPRPKEPKGLAPASGLGVPGSLRSTSLISSALRGAGVQGPSMALYASPASMPLAPLRADSIRPPERGVRRRLMARFVSKEAKRGSWLFKNFQTPRIRFPFRRPSVGAAQGDARHGCRARSDGPGMALRDDPRSGAGARGVLQSKTRMQGRPSFWLLFLGHTRKSDSPSRAKPMLQQTSTTDPSIPGQRPSRASSLLQKPTQKHCETFASGGLNPIALNRQSTVRRPCVCA